MVRKVQNEQARLTSLVGRSPGPTGHPAERSRMTSSSQYRHISVRWLLRDRLKRLYFAIGVRLGVHILPAHYYAPVPNIVCAAHAPES